MVSRSLGDEGSLWPMVKGGSGMHVGSKGHGVVGTGGILGLIKEGSPSQMKFWTCTGGIMRTKAFLELTLEGRQGQRAFTIALAKEGQARKILFYWWKRRWFGISRHCLHCLSLFSDKFSLVADPSESVQRESSAVNEDWVCARIWPLQDRGTRWVASKCTKGTGLCYSDTLLCCIWKVAVRKFSWLLEKDRCCIHLQRQPALIFSLRKTMGQSSSKCWPCEGNLE